MSNVFYNMKHGTEEENYGRDIITKIVKQFSEGKKEIHILDLGAGSGSDLLNCKEVIKNSSEVNLYGLESYPPNIEKLKSEGVSVHQVNIECDSFPFEDHKFDVVIMNQCLEHTKEIFHIFAEIGRVLKKNGICIVGVPNLASFHNRILLLFGKQPSSIRMFGPHVRGITKNDFISFVQYGGFFENQQFFGSNFYPFNKTVSRLLSRLFPSASVSIFFVIRRTEKIGNFSDVLDEVFFETPFLK